MPRACVANHVATIVTTMALFQAPSVYFARFGLSTVHPTYRQLQIYVQIAVGRNWSPAFRCVLVAPCDDEAPGAWR